MKWDKRMLKAGFVFEIIGVIIIMISQTISTPPTPLFFIGLIAAIIGGLLAIFSGQLNC